MTTKSRAGISPTFQFRPGTVFGIRRADWGGNRPPLALAGLVQREELAPDRAGAADERAADPLGALQQPAPNEGLPAVVVVRELRAGIGDGAPGQPHREVDCLSRFPFTLIRGCIGRLKSSFVIRS